MIDNHHPPSSRGVRVLLTPDGNLRLFKPNIKVLDSLLGAGCAPQELLKDGDRISKAQHPVGQTGRAGGQGRSENFHESFSPIEAVPCGLKANSLEK